MRRSAAQVEIAHLACALAMSPIGAILLDQAEIEAEDLADFAYDWLSKNAPATNAQNPPMSRELSELLSRAQQLARRKGNAGASSADVIESLFSDALDLTSARFVLSAQNVSMQARTPQHRPRYQAQFPSDADASHRARMPAHPGHGPLTQPPQPLADQQRQHERRPSRLLTATYSWSLPLPAIGSAEVAAAVAPVAAGPFPQTVDHQGAGRAGVVDDQSCERDSSRRSLPSRSPPRNRKEFFRRRAWPALLSARDNHGLGWTLNVRETSSQRARSTREGSQLKHSMMSVPRATAMHAARAHEPDERWDEDDTRAAPGERAKRFYLSLDDDVVRAPSIGTKTAAKLNGLGIFTVRDLLSADAHGLAKRAQTKFFSVQRVTDWQVQARLVCTIPWLRGTHAQLLAGAGFDSAEAITRAETAILCSAILRFAATREGQCVLRAGPPPDLERIAQWVKFAEQAEPQRAAAA